LYSTIAVFGATQWKSPVWLGLPVQWCGLVYADALYRLARYDPGGIWKHLAQGITVSGIQQSWPAGEPQYQGLLPDSFVLRAQKRNGPAINPATVEACAAQYFDQGPVYDFRCFRAQGLMVHAPGQIRNAVEAQGRVSFQVQSRLKNPFFVLINGLAKAPRIQLNGKSIATGPNAEFLSKQRQLILRANGTVLVELEL